MGVGCCVLIEGFSCGGGGDVGGGRGRGDGVEI